MKSAKPLLTLRAGADVRLSEVELRDRSLIFRPGCSPVHAYTRIKHSGRQHVPDCVPICVENRVGNVRVLTLVGFHFRSQFTVIDSRMTVMNAVHENVIVEKRAKPCDDAFADHSSCPQQGIVTLHSQMLCEFSECLKDTCQTVRDDPGP